MTIRNIGRPIGVWLCLGTLVAGGLAYAQTGTSKTKAKSKSGTVTVEALNKRAMDMATSLFKDADDISKGFEDLGEYERAKNLLEVLQKLDPKNPKLKERIDQLTEKLLDSSEFEFELDVSRGWTPPVAFVQKDKLVRIEAAGEYKFVATLNSTVEGLPADDTGTDLVSSLPVGALIGVVVNPDTKKVGKPFAIKSKYEWTPQQPGYLQLRMNLPNGHKCTGKVKVKLSGATKLST